MSQVLVDILLAVYNGEKYLNAQLNSIFSQTHQDFHLWIRDNCSQDHTVALIEVYKKKYPGKITLVKAVKNEGFLVNFAALAAFATAPYIMFCDHDDVWLPEKISKTLKEMQKLEQAKGRKAPLLVHTDLKVVDKELNEIHSSFWKFCKLNPKKKPTLARQLLQNQITGCTVMVNKELLSLALPIPMQAAVHDWWLGLAAVSFGYIGLVDEATILYRQHGGNDTGAKPYSFWSYLKRLLNRTAREKLLSNRHKVIQQAEAFLNQYQTQLNSSQIKTAEAFLHFNHAVFFKKAYLMFKYGFYKIGFYRNAWQLIGPRNFMLLFQKKESL